MWGRSPRNETKKDQGNKKRHKTWPALTTPWVVLARETSYRPNRSLHVSLTTGLSSRRIGFATGDRGSRRRSSQISYPHHVPLGLFILYKYRCPAVIATGRKSRPLSCPWPRWIRPAVFSFVLKKVAPRFRLPQRQRLTARGPTARSETDRPRPRRSSNTARIRTASHTSTCKRRWTRPFGHGREAFYRGTYYSSVLWSH